MFDCAALSFFAAYFQSTFSLRYTNADLKICQNLRLYVKIICWRFHIKHLLLFEICAREICQKFVYKHSEQKNMLKISLLFKKFTNLRIKNAKFSEYCFYMNTNRFGFFQICISIPLRHLWTAASECSSSKKGRSVYWMELSSRSTTCTLKDTCRFENLH